MKLTYALTALVLGLTLSTQAHAKKKKEQPCPPPIATPVPQPTPPISETHNDARFTYAKAEQYFAHAQMPTASQLVGTWIQTGKATFSESSGVGRGWYAPTGVGSFSYGWSTTYQANFVYNFQLSTGAFGESVLTLDRKIVSTAENKHVIAALGLSEVKSYSSEGFVYRSEEDYMEKQSRVVTCRLVTPVSLLCASVYYNPYSRTIEGGPYSYSLLKKSSAAIQEPAAPAASVKKSAPVQKPQTKKTPSAKHPVLK